MQPSRRDAIRSLGGWMAVATCGAVLSPGNSTIAADDASRDDPYVDTHLHVASSRLSRAATQVLPAPFNLTMQPGGAERLARLIEQELKAARVGHALCMPSAAVSDADPLGIELSVKQAALIKGPKLHFIGVAHPERFDRDHLARVEEVLKQGKVKALKAYLGYLHYDPLHPGYRPYYRLAAKYNIPVIFHTGDTYFPDAKVKFAQPLAVDELAGDLPETTFVLAHFGNPWIRDAAQVVYKNANVYVDLSAFLIGDEAAFAKMETDGTIDRTVKRVREGIEYAETPERFLFGSDWPLSPIAVYRQFVERLFPKEHHAAVLGRNAKKLFGLE